MNDVVTGLSPGLSHLDLAPGEAMFMPWDHDEYHGDRTCTSNTHLGWFRDGPAIYQGRRFGSIPDKQTKSMVLGTYLHMKVLEPEVWRSKQAPPRPFRPGNADGSAKKKNPEGYKAYEEWKADCVRWESGLKPGMIALDDLQAARLRGMIDGVPNPPPGMISGLRNCPEANDWLMTWDGQAERPIVWRHPSTGVLVRLKPDRIIEAEDDTLLVPDLKSTDDPSEQAFEWSIKQFGYHRQAALYTDGIQALFPGRRVVFVFVVVRNKPPYEVGTYEPNPDALATGRRQYTAALAELKQRTESNDWLADWQKGCRLIGLPNKFAYEEM